LIFFFLAYLASKSGMTSLATPLTLFIVTRFSREDLASHFSGLSLKQNPPDLCFLSS
jgi:hypothetical protein